MDSKTMRFGFQFSEKMDEREYKWGDEMEIQIMREGKRDHYEYGEINVTQDMMNEIIMNFKTNKARQDIAVNENHDPDGKAVARFKDVYKKDWWLYAEVELTNRWAELMNDKVYKYFSPEYLTKREDGETGEKVKNLLIGWGFTNHPYFKDMEKVVAHDKSVLSETDKSGHILFDNQSNMADVKTNETPEVQEEEVKEEVKEEENEVTEENEEEEKKEMSEKVDAQTFSEMKKEFTETKKKYNELLSEKRKKQFSENFDQLVKDEKGMLPKDKDKVVEFCEKIGEENAKVFFEIVGNMKNVADMTKETEGEDKKFSEDDIGDMAKKFAEKNNVKLSKAYTEVMKQLRK